jgi:hypothetical protein
VRPEAVRSWESSTPGSSRTTAISRSQAARSSSVSHSAFIASSQPTTLLRLMAHLSSLGTGNMGQAIADVSPSAPELGQQDRRRHDQPVELRDLRPPRRTGRQLGPAQIAAALPHSQVLKAFNTTFAATLAAGTVEPLTTTVLIAGDDADAKATLAGVLTSGGIKAIDAVSLKRTRELEAVGFLRLTLAVNENVS